MVSALAGLFSLACFVALRLTLGVCLLLGTLFVVALVAASGDTAFRRLGAVITVAFWPSVAGDLAAPTQVLLFE